MLIRLEELKKILSGKYSINVTSINDAPRGFVAETYYATDKSGTKYFIKVIDAKSRHKEDILASLPVLTEMHQREITDINYPLKAIDGSLFYADKKIIFLVFNYVEGTWKRNYDNSKFFNALKHIHELDSSSFRSEIKAENFEINFEDLWLNNFERLKHDKKLQSKLGSSNTFFMMIEKDFILFKRVIRKCKVASFKNVITHGDAPGNVLVNTGGEISIIDWDNLLLAPIERDLWFHRFDHTLKSVYPNYQVNELVYTYYVLKRYFEDFAEYLAEIYKPDATVEHVEKTIEDIKHDIFEWLQPLVDGIKKSS
jgi:spectinomycin phosphotransferase